MAQHYYSKIILHIIWSTHNRDKSIGKSLQKKIADYLKSYVRDELGIHLLGISVNPDHLHLLVDFTTHLSVGDVVKRMKSGSSNYIMKNNLSPKKFSWGRGYAVFSVSESGKKKVLEYISNQETHHRDTTFSDEYAHLLKKYKVSVNSDKTKPLKPS